MIKDPRRCTCCRWRRRLVCLSVDQTISHDVQDDSRLCLRRHRRQTSTLSTTVFPLCIWNWHTIPLLTVYLRWQICLKTICHISYCLINSIHLFQLNSICSKPISAILAMMLLSSVFTNTVTTTIFAEMILSIMLTFRYDNFLLYASLAFHDLLLTYNTHDLFKWLFYWNKNKTNSEFMRLLYNT